MRYSFRLAEVVNHVPDPRRRPGTIKAICDYTGLDRHQVAALLKNEVKYVPLDALSKLCGYLIERGFAKADELPGRLFGVEPEHFWELLARRRRLELCLGVRRGDAAGTLDDAWVVASDSVLLGEILNGATTLTSAPISPSDGDGQPVAIGTVRPHPEHVHQSLVWSPEQATVEECQRMARGVYEDFCEVAGDKALVCLGSIKSNPVVELLLATAFGCEPFLSQDDLPASERRSCPIFLRYRDDDPHPLSCCGGQRAARGQSSNKPGIYYETAAGKWECCQWDPTTHDAAFVFYIHRESQGRMEMALGGFSGRATRLLARVLARRGEEFWPPVYSDEGIQIGAFVVKFALTGHSAPDRAFTGADQHAEETIIRLDSEVIARRMQQHVEAAT
ncbi:MAG TPA: helix-turn-helix transcriptional regulator [Pirellulaceae bacterium]|nr:helix-turn-helix transcriptional regulator [Pirellulaceae bacterium]